MYEIYMNRRSKKVWPTSRRVVPSLTNSSRPNCWAMVI